MCRATPNLNKVCSKQQKNSLLLARVRHNDKRVWCIIDEMINFIPHQQNKKQ